MPGQDDSGKERIDIDAQSSPHFAGGTGGLDGGLLDAGQMRPDLLVEAPAFIRQ